MEKFFSSFFFSWTAVTPIDLFLNGRLKSYIFSAALNSTDIAVGLKDGQVQVCKLFQPTWPLLFCFHNSQHKINSSPLRNLTHIFTKKVYLYLWPKLIHSNPVTLWPICTIKSFYLAKQNSFSLYMYCLLQH